MERIETVVVGGGQAGLAMSEQLGKRGRPHVVLERYRIAERWRSERWDGLHANGPAWHDRLPGMEIPGVAPEGFATRDQMVDYFAAYADRIEAPVRCGVSVGRVQPIGGGSFRVETSAGVIEANNVVAATGPFQRGIVPDVVPLSEGVLQLHSNAYRNPAQLPAGAILVVGAGSSGAQIADELARAGRRVFLSVGRHQRPPRRYRGQDFCYWLGVLGLWDLPRDPGVKHVTIAVSGAYGGRTIDFRRLAAEGVVLVGRMDRFADGLMHFAPDLAENLAEGDANYLSLLDQADAYVAREGLAFPPEPEARVLPPDPACVTRPIMVLDLHAQGITTIIWATGYALDFGWLDAGPLDDHGAPMHQRGVTNTPGLYLLGLSWLSRRASSFIFGVEHDAAYLADHIAARMASPSRAYESVRSSR